MVDIIEQTNVDTSEIPKRQTKPRVSKKEQPTPEQFQEWKARQEERLSSKAKDTKDSPKTTKPKSTKLKEPPPDMPKSGVIKEGLSGLYAGIGMMLMPFDPQCAGVVMGSAEQCSEAMEELARTNPAVRKAIMSMLKTSAWGGVFAAHLPILMAIMSHHTPLGKGGGQIDQGKTGVLRYAGVDDPSGHQHSA